MDVFTEIPYLGNPVAVIFDGGGLSIGQMQRIARWNLREQRGAIDYAVREQSRHECFD